MKKIEKSFGGAWFNRYEHSCKYDISESFVSPLSLNELLLLSGEPREVILEHIADMHLTYGERCGIRELRIQIAGIYKTIPPDCIITSHAGVGANELVFSAFHEPEGEMISIVPTYQQLKTFPKIIGCCVKEYELFPENQCRINYDALRRLITPRTKLISLCNPNNPYGKLFGRDELLMLAEVAHEADCYILCDEIYSGLGPEAVESQFYMCDLYEKGISTCSMSKTYSLPGLRIGWIACQDRELLARIADLRHYHTMECSILTEYIAAIAVKHRREIIQRNQKIIGRNYTYFLNWIETEHHVSFRKPDVGPVLIIDYDFDLPSVDFCKTVVEETGVMLMPGYAFGLEHCFRIGLTASPSMFREALEILSDYIRTHF